MTVEWHPRITEFLVSRVCHDLVSPVGAINNGVELMQELGADAGNEALGLIEVSAAQASVRLKCFRLAYGSAGADKNIGFKDIREVFIDWIKSSTHVKVEFEENLGVKFSMPPVGFFKTLLNLMIFAEECCRGEGKIFISALDGNKGMKILVTGNTIAFREGAEKAFKGEASPEEIDPRLVHAYITQAFAKYFSLEISHNLDSESGRLVLNISF